MYERRKIMNTILLGIFCFIGGGMVGITLSCIMQVSHAADNYQYTNEKVDNDEQETRPVIEK